MQRSLTRQELAIIRGLVGEATPEQLRYVECFVAKPVSLFVPAVGPCQYALSHDHTHPGYSFVLAFDRNTGVIADGRTIYSEPGMVMAMMPDSPHHELERDDPPRYVAIIIDREQFETQLALYEECNRETFRYRQFLPEPDLIVMLRSFMNECENDLPGRIELLAAMGQRIIHSLIRAALKVTARPSSGTVRLEIHRAIHYLHDHFAERLTVADLAGVAGISPPHFSRLFRRETGHSPLDYLIRTRIQRSRILLRAGTDSVTSVALKCGFATPSHFTDCFRKQCGVSPSEYLKCAE
ncbi:MAG: AraC family transcriptional regulator [Desulfuromonadaceae bacterium]|nr:AraC family transcriptional regulator [Desulfuromonadaceae bacterium]MDD5105631.1 AraC family transcriptional regulator [Desulfuromonadaceae bacterium]